MISVKKVIERATQLSRLRHQNAEIESEYVEASIDIINDIMHRFKDKNDYTSITSISDSISILDEDNFLALAYMVADQLGPMYDIPPNEDNKRRTMGYASRLINALYTPRTSDVRYIQTLGAEGFNRASAVSVKGALEDIADRAEEAAEDE